MSVALRNLLIDIIKRQTALSREANLQPGRETEMSEKAQTAKRIIEQSEFCDDDKKFLAELSSLFLGEPVKIENEDSDRGEQLKNIYLYTLLVSLKAGDDQKGIDFGSDLKILKTILDIGDLYGEGVPDSFKDLTWGGLTECNELTFSFKDSDICNKVFRFATDEEIEEFVGNLSEKTIRFWFTPVSFSTTALS